MSVEEVRVEIRKLVAELEGLFLASARAVPPIERVVKARDCLGRARTLLGLQSELATLGRAVEEVEERLANFIHLNAARLPNLT